MVQPIAQVSATPAGFLVTVSLGQGPVVVRELTKADRAEVLVAPAIIRKDQVVALEVPVVIKADPEAGLVDQEVTMVDRAVALVAVKTTIDSCARLMAPITTGATSNGVRLTKNYFASPSPSMRDGESSPAGEDRASAREISNLVAAQDESVENDRGLSDLLWQWGQFLDHDIDFDGGSRPGGRVQHRSAHGRSVFRSLWNWRRSHQPDSIGL